MFLFPGVVFSTSYSIYVQFAFYKENNMQFKCWFRFGTLSFTDSDTEEPESPENKSLHKPSLQFYILNNEMIQTGMDGSFGERDH